MWVYKITNEINGKCYIGITTNLELRWNCHKCAPKCPSLKSPLYSAMRKYGLEKFKFEILEDNISDIKLLGEKERYYIKEFHSHISEHGYNITWGGERRQYDANPRTSLTVEEVVEIRTTYSQGIIGVLECWKNYSNKISYSAFEKIWEGITWRGIMMEVYTKENKKKLDKFKVHKGDKNGNAIYSNEEVLTIRKFYVTHSLRETYVMFGNRSKSKISFRSIIDKSYLHIPVYNKRRKVWTLFGKVININDFNPVSTIPVSRE